MSVIFFRVFFLVSLTDILVVYKCMSRQVVCLNLRKKSLRGSNVVIYIKTSLFIIHSKAKVNQTKKVHQ